MRRFKIIKLAIHILIFLTTNNIFSQNVILENQKTANLFVEKPTYFFYCIPDGYKMDTLYSFDGNVRILNDVELEFTPNRIGIVKIQFLLHSLIGDSILIEKTYNSIVIPKPHLVFSTGFRKIDYYNLDNIDSLKIGVIWPEAHVPCFIESFKILILNKDSSTKLFSCKKDTISKDFFEYVKGNKPMIEEIVFFNVYIKTTIGKFVIPPVNFLNNINNSYHWNEPYESILPNKK